MKSHPKSWRLMLLIFASIIFVFLVNQAHAAWILSQKLEIGEVYSTLDGPRSKTMEVFSANEIEVRGRGGMTDRTILLADYTCKDGKVRIVLTVLGTREVRYYEIIKEGLRAANGCIFYTKAAKPKAEAEARAAKLKAEIEAKIKAAAAKLKREQDRLRREEARKEAKLREKARMKAAMIKTIKNVIFYDRKTNFEWLAGPDRGTTWMVAVRWVHSLPVIPGGGNWRMPSLKELEALYKKGVGTYDDPQWTKVRNTSWTVWTGVKGQALNFRRGASYTGLGLINTYQNNMRGFAVRNRTIKE